MRTITCALITTACFAGACGDRGPDSAEPAPEEPGATDTSTAPDPPTTTPTASRSGQTDASAPTEKESGDGDAAVTIGMTNDLVFTPEAVTITAGETIEWVNDSFLVHTVTCDPDRAVEPDKHVRLPDGAATFHSGKMAQGDTYSRSFPVAGEYTYFCVPHETDGMIGTITVEPKE